MVRRWSLTGHFLILYYPPHAAEDVQRVGCLLSIATEGKSVAQLSWSGHAGRAHLATAGADGSVRVWALLGGGGGGGNPTATLLADLRGHTGRVLCVSWSLTDAHVLYTGEP
jgi:WD40 repeat protein